MDVKREGVAKKKMIRRIIYIILTLAAVGVISWRLSLLKPAAPTVERATVWIDTVKRGPMLRRSPRLRHAGAGRYRVDSGAVRQPGGKILAQSGDDVKPNTILMVLTNPDMEVAANDLRVAGQTGRSRLTGHQGQAPEQDLRSAVRRRQHAQRPEAGGADQGSRRATAEAESEG